MIAAQWAGRDRDKYWGPFTWSPESHSSGWGVVLKSNDDEDRLSYLRVSMGRRTLLIRTPEWLLKPWRRKKKFSHLNPFDLQQTVKRLGRDWYWEVYPREIGFIFHEDSLHTYWGVQNHSWGGPDGSKSKCFFYPWKQTRIVRHQWLGLDGKFFADVPDGWEDRVHVEESVPSRRFVFRDYDGEFIVATIKLGVAEHALGRKGWSWLSLFVPNKVYRSFDIRFSSEVGPEKGSWKGGTVGHSISSDDESELHEAAFKRYCLERGKGRSKHDAPMTFLHEVF